jgi:RpiR family carbohydrate utilization transcriptional regulator
MTVDTPLLTTISAALPELKKSEAKVAGVILEDPDAATRSSIAALASAAGVSEPSVNRFCKRFGATGFPDFKLQLARSLASGVRYISRAVKPGDNIDTYPTKLFDSTISALILARDQLPTSAIAEAVEHLAKAKRIFFFGLGTSAAVAKDAQHKFFRLKVPVSMHEDPLMLRMLAAAGEEGDVFFLISHTGRTRALYDVAELAKDSGATVLSLTTEGSPLAEASDCSIALNIVENTEEYLPMTSRIVQLVILDVLATGITLARGEDLQPHLARLKESLRATRFPEE